MSLAVVRINLVIPFGLTIAPATPQRFVDTLLSNEFDNSVFCYLDDIIIARETFDKHVLLIYNPQKAQSSQYHHQFPQMSELNYLAYVIDDQGLHEP